MIPEVIRDVALSAAITFTPATPEEPGAIPLQEVFNQGIDLAQAQEVPDKEKAQQFIEIRERINNFSWEDFDNIERLDEFKKDLINGYIQATENSNHAPFELNKNTIFYKNNDKLAEKADELSPGDILFGEPVENIYDFQNDTGIYYLVNLENIDKNLDKSIFHPGYFLADRLWNSWMLEDIRVSENGELLNNPAFKSNDLNNKNADFYFGGSIISEEGEATLVFFHEYLAHAVSTRLLLDKIGLDDREGGYSQIENYFMLQEALDILEFSRHSGMSPDDFYDNYSSSNLDEILKMLGRNVTIMEDDDDLDRDKIDEDLYNGFRYAQLMDLGYENIDYEISQPRAPINTA